MALEVYNFCPEGITAGSGKFVIARRIYGTGDDIIIFSDYEQDNQHRDIVAHWQRRVKMPMHEVGLKPAGGGMWFLLDDGRTLCLHGASAAYGGFDKDGFREELAVGSVFGETALVFDDKYGAVD
ncbi:MAG: hypothetical protein LIQ30_05100 [Planctomycetes bacterium]|nr:hypothetical protein [Planctomycetota bacterium]